MIESLQIRNFKGFKSLDLKDLARVNVVTGPNGAGKTALLEAIFIAARGLPDALLQANLSRNMPVPQPLINGASAPGPLFRGIIDHFFHQTPTEREPKLADEFSLKYRDSAKREYSLRGAYDTGGDAPLSSMPAAPPLVLRRKSPNVDDSLRIGTNAQGQIQAPPAALPLGPVSYAFPGTQNYNDFDNVIWYSKLRESREISALVEFFKSKFPFIKHIEVLAPNGVEGLYAELEDGSLRRLNLISAGIHKLVSLLLGITENREGVVCIDEIENGIFHEKYAVVWDIISEYAEKSRCQLFVSTHSLECLQALHSVAAKTPDNFSLIRFDARSTPDKPHRIAGKALVDVLGGGVEIR